MELTIEALFSQFCNNPETEIQLLPQSGSSRKNFIGKCGDKKYIITQNEDVRENEAFFYFTNIFNSLNLNTPKLFFINDHCTVYIQEYLGANTLSEIIATKPESKIVTELIKKTLQNLYLLQSRTQGKIDYSNTFDYEIYDELPITHDLYYFKNFLVDVLEIPYHKSKLLKEFAQLSSSIASLQPSGLMIRDFQARNVMVDDAQNVSFIDYQGAMQGPLMYDVISLLYQAKANFSEHFRAEMLNFYLSFFQNDQDVAALKFSIKPIILIRFLQVLGAYGFRGIIQRKAHFLQSLQQGIDNLVGFQQSENLLQSYPELSKIITALDDKKSSIKF